MDVNRRKILVGSIGLALMGLVEPGAASSRTIDLSDLPGASRWHPFVRSLVQRARQAQGTADEAGIERIIRQVAASRTGTEPLVIKWLADPSRAFQHLSGFGLDRLLEMSITSLWSRAARLHAIRDRTRKSWRCVPHGALSDIFRVAEHDLALMAPKLLAKSRVMAEGASVEAVFEVRAVAAQIGWLETCIPVVAAQAVTNIELLLSSGFSESDEVIHHQLRMFEAYELGLLATWETPEVFICVPRTIGV